MAANGASKRYIGLLVVLALALLSWWLLRQERTQEAGSQAAAHRVDYSMRDFEMTVMDDGGRPSQRLQAISMVHYSDDGSSELQQPRLLLYSSAGQAAEARASEHWSVRAERARLYPGGVEMVLEGRVVMQRFDVAGKVTLELETRDLKVNTERQQASSVEQVEIRERHGVTRARGLEIDLKAGQLELLAAVRGEYVRER